MAHRSLTLLPTRPVCRVCDGLRRVWVVRLLDPAVGGRGVVACPHCTAGPIPAVPIYTWPWRQDTRRGGDAA